MTTNNSKKYNTHARTPSLSVYDLDEDMGDNYRTAERIRARRENVDLFAPEFEVGENIDRKYSSLSKKDTQRHSYSILDMKTSWRDNNNTAKRIKERKLVDLFAPEFRVS
ncbi:MAG: hypothetical protein Q7R87_03000 [Nanoarchaeota archaeon]|nr:hypothetical protein [Nanoarchaeota archaeon]